MEEDNKISDHLNEYNVKDGDWDIVNFKRGAIKYRREDGRNQKVENRKEREEYLV